jgi:hypothetical protein
MKFITLQTHKVVIILLLLLAGVLQSYSLLAQNKEKRSIETRKDGKVHIRTEREKDGKKEVFERTYDADDSLANEKDAFSFPDSMDKEFGDLNWERDFRQHFNPGQSFSFSWPSDSVSDQNGFFLFKDFNADSLFVHQKDMFRNFRMEADGNHFQFFYPNEPGSWSGSDPAFSFRMPPFSQRFSFDNALGEKNRFEFDEKEYELREEKTPHGKKYIITRKKQPLESGSFWEDSEASIHNLKVTPQSGGFVNVSFFLPAKGDVLLKVTNIQGKEVLSEKWKAADGKQNRHLNLSRQPKGVYFVTITQNNDGEVKRVELR